MAKALKDLAKLDKTIKTLAIADRMGQTVDELERAMQGAEERTQEAMAKGNLDPTQVGQLPSVSRTTPGGGAGVQGVTEHDPQPLSATAVKGEELQVQGTWNGKVIRQLFESASSGQLTEQAKQLLIEHQRVVEDRFRRDDVPEEYHSYIRTYFTALNQKEREWTQNEK